MSAFLVKSECINSIVTYLHQQCLAVDCSDELGPIDVRSKEDLHRLANAFFALNCAAMDQRYGTAALKHDLEVSGPFAFRFVHRPPVAVYKALSCLLYQCMEGDVPKRELYSALEGLTGRIARRIVQDLPAYEAAPWGD
ncbi:MAG: hypothetical protein AB9869_03730 [Verrucomicrobiia bacterium]